MRMRWFGEPWPSAEERAPVCDNDDYRAEPPLGEYCIGCECEIVQGERGVIMGATPDMPFAWLSDEGEPALWPWVCAEHIDCHIRSTVGPHWETLIERVPGEPRPII